MPRQNSFAWSNLSKAEQLKMVQKASRNELRLMARAYDWSKNPEAVISALMAQKSIDLCTALTVFMNGDPARFNYLSKRDITDEYHPTVKVLDNICLRVNSGFYRIVPGQRIEGIKRLNKWLNFQAADRTEGRCGRWILDESIVLPALMPPPASERAERSGLSVMRSLRDGFAGRVIETIDPQDDIPANVPLNLGRWFVPREAR